MGTVIRIAIVAMAASLPGFAPAESMLRLTSQLPMTPLTGPHFQECWIDHVQVQPARIIRRTVLGIPVGAAANGGPTDEHLGAEHWTADAQRACKLQLTPITARAAYDSSWR